MAKEKHRDDNNLERQEEEEQYHRHRNGSKSKSESDSDSVDEKRSTRKKSSRKRSRSSRGYYSDEDSESESGSESESESESEEERRRRKRRERKKREEKRRRKEKEKKKKRRRDEDSDDDDDDDDDDKRKKKKMTKKKKKREDKEKRRKKKEKGKTSAVTNSWGKFGIIRETDMWNKRPEFTAWLAEVKKINLESLPNYEEKQMFKEFMEDHNTATFPSKKYYNLDAYYKHKMEKEMKKGLQKVSQTERSIFDDEEQRRQELLREREIRKEQEVEALKRSMQNGLAQAMKEQAQLREEMAYQFKIGNNEAAAAIQRRLDPDLPM